MKWQELTRGQQTAARRLVEQLWAAGAKGPTTSNVARHLDAAQDWANGNLGLEELCEQAGWEAPTPPVEETEDSEETASARLGAAIAARADAETTFHAELAAAKAAGITANEIARQCEAARVASRPTVLRLLGAETVRAAAATVVAATGWAQQIRVTVRAGRVEVRVEGKQNADRLRAAFALDEQLRAAGLYLTLLGGDPALTPCEDLANGEALEILRD